MANLSHVLARRSGSASLVARTLSVIAFVSLHLTAPASAQEGNDRADLAQQLSNPVASLISVPIQVNYDYGFGPDEGYRLTTNVQPVVPIDLNEDWNIISRTIVPIIQQDDIGADTGSQFGTGDVVQSVFFSPKEPGPGGVIWGAGPVALIPTASDDLLGTEKWGLGPTAVALKQSGPWTYGGLTNHIWSFAGENDRADVNSTFLQPFIAYTTADATTFALNTESTYDWESEQWSAPINANISQVTSFGSQLVSIGFGLRYWAEAPEGGPDGLGARFTFTLLYPR